MKVWGVVLVLAVLAALLVPAAVPASAANMAWSTISTPAAVPNNILTADDQWIMDAAPDGKTVFAYSNSAGKLYRSTNGGATWSATGVGTGLAGIGTVVALAVSSDYANDSTVVIATGAAGTPANTIYRSVNNGGAFGPMPALPGTIPIVGDITSIDVGPHYAGGQAILAAYSNGANGGGAARLIISTLSWQDLVFTGDVYAIAFSPKHRDDAQVLGVGYDNTLLVPGYVLFTKFGVNNVNADVQPATLFTGANSPTTNAVLAFPADYDWYSNNVTFVGIGVKNAAAGTAAVAGNDVYRVRGAFPPSVSTTTDLNVSGAGTDTNICSLAFKGNLADGFLYAGLQNGPVVRRATAAGGSTVNFVPVSKSPTGAYNTQVIASPAAEENTVWAITSGAQAAFATSPDGLNFNLTALINVSAEANVKFVDQAVLDANTMYLLAWDDVNVDGAYTALEPMILFKTTDAGANWSGVFTQNAEITGIYPSPAYATDKTLYLTQSNSRIWKSSNEGASFVGLSSPNSLPITAFAVVDANTYYVGGNNAIYKNGTYVAATIGGDVAESIAYVSATDMFVGTTNGSVYRSTNGGVSFQPVGGPSALGLGTNVAVLTDVNYATNKIVYAANNSGVYRWTIDTSATWTNISGAIVADRIVQGTEGTLYITTPPAIPPAVGVGLYRIVNPTDPPSAIVCDAMNNAAFNLGLISANPGSIDVSVMATGTDQVPNNTIYAIIDGAATGTPTRMATFQDTMVAAPAITAPAANGQVATNTNLTWGAVPGGRTYTAELATDAAFAGAVGLTGAGVTNATSITPLAALTPGTDYWWKVRATAPLTSKFSATTKFSVLLAQPGNQIEGPGGNSLQPSAGAINVPIKPVFQWAAINGAQSYDLQVSDNPVFVNPLDAQTGLNTNVWTFTKELENGKTYYWRVRAVSATGVASAWVSNAFTTAPEAVDEPGDPGTAPVITITQPAAPVITITQPPQQTIVVTQAADSDAPTTPVSVWVLIVIGAVLIIAVIVLIVRTRRV